MKKGAAIFIVITLAGISLVFLGRYMATVETTPNAVFNPATVLSMRLTSTAFQTNGSIPSKYTCDGKNVSPPLAIGDVPENTKSLALIVDDPDAPRGVWTHWVAVNIDPGAREIAEGSVPPGSLQTGTSFGQPGWGGPCPPSGTHHYVFKLFALDTKLIGLDEHTPVDMIVEAMAGHVLAKAELVGLYSRRP